MDEGGCSEAQSQPPLVDWQAAATSRSSARCCASVSVPWSSRRDRKLIVRAAVAGSASQGGVDVAFVMAFSAAVVVVVVGSVAEPRRRVQIPVVVAAVVTAAARVTAEDGWCCCLLGGAGWLRSCSSLRPRQKFGQKLYLFDLPLPAVGSVIFMVIFRGRTDWSYPR